MRVKIRISALRPLIIPVLLISCLVVLASFIPVFTHIDNALLIATSTLPREWTPAVEAISHLGDYYTNVVMIVLIMAFELFRRRYIRAFVSGLSLLAFPMFFVIKEAISRVRPVGDFIIAHGLPGYSFPSGHAVTSAVAFGLLAVLTYSRLRSPWKYIIPGASVLTIIAVGMSRVYLGAHFPTDVVAGWLLAFIVLSLLRALSILIAKRTGKSIRQTTEDTEPDVTSSN